MRLIKHKLAQIVVVAVLLTGLASLAVVPASAAETCKGGQSTMVDGKCPGYQCGKGDTAVHTTIDFGCVGEKCQASADRCNAIIDVTFAIIRFLSTGVGLVIVGSLIYAGIQFASSKGDPKASELAQGRIQNT